MAITPINVTRVSHNLRTMSLLESLRRSTVDIFTQQSRLASGRALSSASDDPVAASQSSRMRQAISQQEQILDNLRHADLMMSAADEALAEVNDLLNQAEVIASQSLGGQADGDERAANAAIIASIRERLMTVGNRQVRGSYIFAGRQTQNPPFVSVLGGTAYVGETGDLLARISLLEQEPTNVPGSTVFGALSAAVTGRVQLVPQLTAETRLEDLGGATGQGIRKGAVVLSDSTGNVVQVDLTTADTVGDVIDRINAAADSAGIAVTTVVQGGGIVLTGSGSVGDTANGSTAADLGLVSDGSSTTATAPPDLGVRVTPNTLLASLNDGEGIPLEGGIRITNGPTGAVVDVSDAVTVQDVINRINTAGLYVFARINDARSGIEIVSQVSGTTLSIGDGDGETASALGIRTMDLSTPLSSLNHGRGVETLPGQADLRITGRDGTIFEVNLDDAETVGDVIEAINTAAEDAGAGVTASISAAGEGLVLTDGSGDGVLSVGRPSVDAFAAEDLGLLQSVEDPDADLIGDDVAAVRAAGVFTALIELESALAANDEHAIGEIAERLVRFSEEVTRVHGVIGARAQAFRERTEQTENAVIATKEFLSQIEDLDYTEAVTRFQQAQTALQASLLSGSQLLNLSLLDFIA